MMKTTTDLRRCSACMEMGMGWILLGALLAGEGGYSTSTLLCAEIPGAEVSENPGVDEQKPEARALIEAVEAELEADGGVVHRVKVQTDEAIVTLAGTVDTILARERAVRTAKAVRGVREVIDRIEVIPTDRSDEAIASELNEALRSDPATEAYELDAGVSGGLVTLRGQVGSYQESQQAAEMAKGVRGVIGLQNELAWGIGASDRNARPDTALDAWDALGVQRAQELFDGRDGNPMADGLMEERIRSALEANPYVRRYGLKVSVAKGKVYLSGVAGSSFEKAQAEAIVSGVRGIAEIENNIAIQMLELPGEWGPRYWVPQLIIPLSF